MKTQKKTCLGSKNGIALIIVLGLLAVLTLIAVAFAIAMRVERLAARNYLNNIRAEQLVKAGIVEAMGTIDQTMSTNCYPDWTKFLGATYPHDAMWSSNGIGSVTNPPLIGAEATNAIPASLIANASTAAGQCTWTNIVTWTNESGLATYGKVAYIVISCSGLLDASYAGGSPRTISSTNINEVNLGALPDFGGDTNNTAIFFANRALDKRYETVTELTALNQTNAFGHTPAIPANTRATDLFAYSYDPGRDLMFTNQNEVGTRGIGLMPKFNINSITNTPEWAETKQFVSGTKPVLNGGAGNQSFQEMYHFMGAPAPGGSGNPSQAFRDYYTQLTNCITGGGNFPKIVANYSNPGHWVDIECNLINYLDLDRIPQLIETSSTVVPYECSESKEDTPLLSEFAVQKCAGLNNTYEVVVKVWYPWYPETVEPADNFTLKVGVMAQEPTPNSYPYSFSMDNGGGYNNSDANLRFTVNLSKMSYYNYDGQHPQFITATSPVSARIAFPNGAAIGVTNGQVCTIPGGVMTNVNEVFVMAQITKTQCGQEFIVNQAMSRPVDGWDPYPPYQPNRVDGISHSYGGPTQFTNEWDWQVPDPRSNNRFKYWAQAGSGFNGPVSSNRFGTTNWCVLSGPSSAYSSTFSQGLPFFWRNGPMETIGEIGHIYTGNLNDDSSIPTNCWYWQTINIMSYKYGAFLLDRMTTRDTNSWVTGSQTLNPTRGMVCISTTNEAVIASLYNSMGIGPKDTTGTGTANLTNVPDSKFQVVLDPTDPNVKALVHNIATSPNRPYWAFQSLFNPNAPYSPSSADDPIAGLMVAIGQENGPGGNANEISRQDPIRKVVDLISFRQNIFEIIMAAQVVGVNGGVLAEKRAMATVYRDSYSGKSFVRAFKWLGD